MTAWNLRQRFDFRGQAVAYDTMGEGEPLVLVHGTPFSSHVWRRIAAELARSYQVHLYDLLGYGQSEKRAGQTVSLDVQTDLFAALVDHWRLDGPRVIAHDFGATTVLRAHLLQGRDYDRLLLFDAVALAPWGSPFVQHVRHHEAAFAGVPEYPQRAMLKAYIGGAIHRTMTDAELEPYLAPWLGPEGQPAFYRQIAQMDQRFTDEVEPLYGKVRCPVSLLWGAEDAWLPVAQGRKLASLIPGCAFREVPDAGHLMQEDTPEVIVAEALAFFR